LIYEKLRDSEKMTMNMNASQNPYIQMTRKGNVDASIGRLSADFAEQVQKKEKE
jgi:hypothetical protein